VRIDVRSADRDQEAAYQNRDVQTIVDHLVRYRDDPKLFQIASEAVITPVATPEATLRARLGGSVADAAKVAAAVDIAGAGARIFAATECERQKGALVERLVVALVSVRNAPATHRETQVHTDVHPHSGKTKTGRKDVVVDAAPFEVYECKFGGGIAQWELDELGDVWATADAEGTDARPCIATMSTMTQIQTRLYRSGLMPHPNLYFAGLVDLPTLARRYPTQQIA